MSLPTRVFLSPTGHSSITNLWHPAAAEARRVRLSDPATLVMTDLTREPPATVTEDSSLDEALENMVLAGVHALLVVRGDLVSGLITSYDIQGDRPLILLMAPSHRRPDQIAVGEIMTPWDQVPKLDWSRASAARVFQLASAFRRMRATHLVVVQNLEDRGAFVRALISRRRLNRQLGLD